MYSFRGLNFGFYTMATHCLNQCYVYSISFKNLYLEKLRKYVPLLTFHAIYRLKGYSISRLSHIPLNRFAIRPLWRPHVMEDLAIFVWEMCLWNESKYFKKVFLSAPMQNKAFVPPVRLNNNGRMIIHFQLKTSLDSYSSCY